MTEEHPELPEIGPTLGTVVEQDRGDLPFQLIHGESLVACAAWALGESGVTIVDLGTAWSAVVESGDTFVLHDPLCPLLPAGFIAECVVRAQTDGVVVVGVRPVTDTVKTIHDGSGGAVVGATVDRDELVAVASPVVVPPAVVADLPGVPTTDFGRLVGELRRHHEVVMLVAPAEGRRVASEDDIRLLEALTTR
jgi:hypothetical protein